MTTSSQYERNIPLTEEVGADFADNKEEFYQALKGIKKMGNE